MNLMKLKTMAGGDMEHMLSAHVYRVELPQTNILILGDSKVRFGKDRGSLDRALPGT